MKNKLFLFTLILGFAFGLITFTSCGDDDEVPTPSAPCQDNENIIVDGIAYNTTKDGDATVIRKSSVDGSKILSHRLSYGLDSDCQHGQAMN